VKVQGLTHDEDDRRRRAGELQSLIRQPSEPAERACPGCDIRCPECGSGVCVCNCAPGCAHAPRQMSSDPENHPVEPNIVPLVYALNRLGVCRPCWSCEGHRDDDGHITRMPHVWFYVRSVVYLSLINHCLFQLHLRKKISHEWRVRVVDWGQTSDSAFSLEPAVGPGEGPGEGPRQGQGPDLDALHRDARVIGGALVSGVREAAQSYLRDMSAGAPIAAVG
jgi:hypothetical protein